MLCTVTKDQRISLRGKVKSDHVEKGNTKAHRTEK
jgi:hypothetical protein